LLSILDSANLLLGATWSSILDSAQRVCSFEYQFDSAVKQRTYRAERCVTDDVSTAVLHDITQLRQVAQLAQYSRSGHTDCVRDLLGCESLTTQCR
jgi:hypothetical protein